MTSILVVDDDPQILRALRITLGARGYDVTTATSGRNALDTASATTPDIILLDLGLPDLDGTDVIHALRAWTATPVVVLSGRATSQDKISALDAGADDYVTKPFRLDELLARLRAVARRTPTTQHARVVMLGHYQIDLDARRATRTADGPDTDESGTAATNGPGTDIRLTPTEWHILDVLLRNPEKLITYRQLLPAVGGPAPKERGHYLREYISRLRRKLEPDPTQPRHLISEPGMGYRFQP